MMYPCHSRVNGASGTLYDSDGNVCTTWRALNDTSRYLIIAGVTIVGASLLSLSIFGILRYTRKRQRTKVHAQIPELPRMTMAHQGYRNRSRGMSTSSVSRDVNSHGYDMVHGRKTRSSSLSSTQIPSPSPLRQVCDSPAISLYPKDHDVESLRDQDYSYNDAHSALHSSSIDRPIDYRGDRYHAHYAPSGIEPTEYLKETTLRNNTADVRNIPHNRE